MRRIVLRILVGHKAEISRMHRLEGLLEFLARDPQGARTEGRSEVSEHTAGDKSYEKAP